MLILYFEIYLPIFPLIIFGKWYLFIYFWLHWVFIGAHRFSLVTSGGQSLVAASGHLSLMWLLLLWFMGLVAL